jgi:phage terminase small subunit
MGSCKLTGKQKKFVELYQGNGAEAARLAGYSGNEDVLKSIAAENLTKPYILQEIQNRQTKDLAPIIATRIKRQEFWSKIMDDRSEEMTNRLRASELLGKSECDFLTKIEHSGNIGLEAMSDEDLKKRLQELREKIK